jgi:hypothetical protein
MTRAPWYIAGPLLGLRTSPCVRQSTNRLERSANTSISRSARLNLDDWVMVRGFNPKH